MSGLNKAGGWKDLTTVEDMDLALLAKRMEISSGFEIGRAVVEVDYAKAMPWGQAGFLNLDLGNQILSNAIMGPGVLNGVTHRIYNLGAGMLRICN
ncbi:putative glucomannan 4-beta-mannosyltransferase 9-like [Sesbania bispinosa]|nr:putative glucomannan 4-beta-mannosyltransferase 9-like [Sesbania bispinosa]